MKFEDPKLVVEIAEWSEEFRNIRLTTKDRVLAEQLRKLQRVIVDEMAAGLRVCSTSWVGLIRFETFDLRIVPKLADGNSHLLQMLAMTGGLKSAWHSHAKRTLLAGSTPDLLDLLSMLLFQESERLLAGGVLYDYAEREESLNVIRGRFLIDRQLKKRCGQFHLLECRFDEHDGDIDENRLIAFTLSAIRRLLRDRSLLARSLSLYEQFTSVCDCNDLNPQTLMQRLAYHRLNSHYRAAHELCKLILDSMGVTDLLAAGPFQANLFLINMNLIFERFVQELIEFSVGTAYQVQYQLKTRSILWDTKRDAPYGSVIPDFVLADSKDRVVVDAKYKTSQKLDNADIYQCFLYAHAFAVDETAPRAFLIVPSTRAAIVDSTVEVRSVGGICKATLVRLEVPVGIAIDEIQTGQPGPIARKLASLLGSIQS